MRTFNHGGDIGDIIYGLSAVRDLGGGELWLRPNNCTRVNMTPEHAALIIPLCEAQPYVTRCIYKDEAAEINLDRFRYTYSGQNLFRYQREVWNLPEVDETEPWLTVPAPKDRYDVIIHRSPRYHNEAFPWKKVVEKYGKAITMVGLEDEHKDFCERFGKVSYIKTADFLELAKIIAGCSLFIGNQSAPCAVAEGLKKRLIQESFLPCPNCQFKRDNAIYFMQGDLTLPDL